VLTILLPPRVAAQPVTCDTCHSPETALLAESAHAALRCQDCHGGPSSYDLPADDLARYTDRSDATPVPFDHGSDFLGKPSRAQIPERCGSCHSNVELMNPYGLRTDQLARYWTSGHGKTLAKTGDERVAVCIDCHGSHAVLPGAEPRSATHPLNVPDTCATCHADAELMADFGLPIEVVTEFRESVHGKQLLEHEDTGAPSCATCHGNHSAMPPGYATVGAVCGKCHANAAEAFKKTVHADQEAFRGCVQCHGGYGEGRHGHRIGRITQHPEVLIRRYTQLVSKNPDPSPDEVSTTLHPEPRRVMSDALPSCTDCHDELEDDEGLQKLFAMLERIADAERGFAATGERLNRLSHGVLLVDAQRFTFEDAKTDLIGLAPLLHALDEDALVQRIQRFEETRGRVEGELDDLERGLSLRYASLVPIWAFAVLFSALLYAKYKQLKRVYVSP
jgi:hypothetical protein